MDRKRECRQERVEWIDKKRIFAFETDHDLICEPNRAVTQTKT